MQHQWSSNVGLRKRAIAGAIAVLIAPLPFWAGAQAAPDQAVPSVTDEAAVGAAGRPAPRLYSVINLGPEAANALLNERGQAAFGSFSYYGTSNAFFDGDRVRDIGTLGGSHTWIGGLNKHGVVVGESEDGEEHSNILGFSWTVSGGMRTLAGTSVSIARDINDRGYIVGQTPAPGITARAVRWNLDGSVTPLGPMPLSLSEAFAINHGGSSTGFTDVASGDIHAAQWDRAGIMTDLGTLGGRRGFGMHINAHGAVAGESDDAAGEVRGFFWTRDSGMVPINVEGGGSRLVAGLNNRGEVVGDTVIGGRSLAYQWTLRRGVVPLPSGSATRSDVFDINNNGEMVGLVERHVAEGGGLRAVRWPALATPIDLNTRLHRPPAGLVLEAGAAINDDGVILAHSNAGLVLLRPGKRGTDAPVLGPMAGFPHVVEVGMDLALTIGFVDNNGAETHTASVTWTDGCTSPAPTVDEARGVGQVRLHHRFCSAGYHAVRARVADSGGRSTQLQRDIVVESPALASVSGKGTLGNAVSSVGSRNLPLSFALWAPLGSSSGDKAGAGSPVVILSGPFQFRSDQVTASAAGGQQARVEGTGRLNGRSGYRFVLEAHDGGDTHIAGTDRLKVRVTHVDAVTGVEVVDYDNGAAVAARSAVSADRTVVADGGLRLRH